MPSQSSKLSRRGNGKRRRGRPAKDLNDRDIKAVERLAGYGLTERAIAHVLDLGSRTFRDKKATDERISAALEKGRALAERKVGEALYRRAIKGELGAIVWWEKTRAGRSDRQSHQVDVNSGVLIVPGPVDPEEWAKAAAEYGRKLGERISSAV